MLPNKNNLTIMTPQELKERYAAIDRTYGSEGRNLYTCATGHLMLTVHLTKGVTPMFTRCKLCGQRATSAMYMVSQRGKLFRTKNPDKIIHNFTKEFWVRPSEEQLLQLHLLGESFIVEHVLQGGLLIKSSVDEMLKAKQN